MSRIFFADELETVATFWRVTRRDGVALGFTSHNRDLVFDGLRHRAAPGMLPSAIRRTADLSRDNLEVQGILAHDAISTEDLRAGRYDRARIKIGVVDWGNLDRATLFHGTIASVSEEANQFEAELLSTKADLEIDTVPRTSPTCRAAFCDDACQLNPSRFTHVATVLSVDVEESAIVFADAPPAASMLHGSLRWLDGPYAGLEMEVLASDANGIMVDRSLDSGVLAGHRALLREGCDHTLATCSTRFANSVNFQGEPYLPGNDLLARYANSSS